MKLSHRQLDRARGALVGGAIGDALGVPYEFKRRLLPSEAAVMCGGGLGPYRPGEWSDDTQMATVIAAVAASGLDLRTEDGLDKVATGFLSWRINGASDVGAQTSSVLGRVHRDLRRLYLPLEVHGLSSHMAAVAQDFHNSTGRSAGNGSLMRTAPVAIRYLGDKDQCADAARKVSSLTHYDPIAGDACAMWCELVRCAVVTRTLPDWTSLLGVVPQLRRAAWEAAFSATCAADPWDFENNGYVVSALQAAYTAVRPLTLVETDDIHPDMVRQALQRAVHAGNDTDTVAAIAGSLIGALAGFSALPGDYRRAVNGWVYQGGTGYEGNLLMLADKIAGHA